MTIPLNSLACRVRRAEAAHRSGDLLTVARIHGELAELGFILSDPDRLYGNQACLTCGEPRRYIYWETLAVSVCMECRDQKKEAEANDNVS